VAIYQASRPDAQVEMVTQGITSAFALYFKVCFMAAFIVSCPFWMYQLWRFISPGLKVNERRAALRFLGPAVPLFLAGVALGYMICPKGFAVLLGFNPPQVMNLNDISDFLDFELRLLAIFGLAFLLPVVLVTLNRIGLVTGAGLGKARPAAAILCGLFSAIATPTTDALTMLALMVPMLAMYFIAEAICRAHDRNKAKADDGPIEIGEPEPEVAT
jgi:sec-independent protein translocase protein TatC